MSIIGEVLALVLVVEYRRTVVFIASVAYVNAPILPRVRGVERCGLGAGGARIVAR